MSSFDGGIIIHGLSHGAPTNGYVVPKDHIEILMVGKYILEIEWRSRRGAAVFGNQIFG
jgi:hypothetical protein